MAAQGDKQERRQFLHSSLELEKDFVQSSQMVAAIQDDGGRILQSGLDLKAFSYL